MSGQRLAKMLGRVWRLVEVLQSRRTGMTATALARESGVSRSTVYRYLELLERAGAPIASQGVNGETRYSLSRDPLPALGPSSAGRLSLGLARELLAPLEGTEAVGDLDRLLARFRGPQTTQPKIAARASKALHDPAVARSVERALASRKKLGIVYRGARREVDPAALRLAGRHAYLVAWDAEKNAWRTFKLARIEGAEVLAAPIVPHPAFDEHVLFGRAVHVWHAAPVLVRVRLAPDVANIAREYPLIDDQRVARQPDGSAIVEARVAGIVEATRWVLGWGRAAEALAPPELRDAVESELSGALARYAGPGVVKGAARVAENGAGKRKAARGRG